jgi:hypothetical protein
MVASRRPLAPVVAAAAVLSLALWPVQIDRAFGLPAHPLFLHVPVVFVPLLGIAALATAVSRRLDARYGLHVAVFGVVTLIATLLTAGAGEAFREDRERALQPLAQTLADHADAGAALRFTVAILTLALAAALFTRGIPKAVLRDLTVLLAITAIVFTVRAGHLGAKLAWGTESVQQTR